MTCPQEFQVPHVLADGDLGMDRCPVQRLVCLVRGSGCFIHDARCHLGGKVTRHPGTPFPRDLESIPHPLTDPGDHQVVEIP